MRNICGRKLPSVRTYERNRYWCMVLFREARRRAVYGIGASRWTFGCRRYWKRRMSDLARILKQRYGIGVEEVY